MTPDQYQQLALETWYKPDEGIPWDEQMNQAILQLNAEAGELASLWAKHLFKPGHDMTRQEVLNELGDVWYYVRIIMALGDIDTDYLTESNHTKLQGGHGWNGSGDKVKARLADKG